MATYLRVNPGSDPVTGALTGAHYRLPSDRDYSGLPEKISAALNSGGSLAVEVEVRDRPPGRALVFLNAANIHSILLDLNQEGRDES